MAEAAGLTKNEEVVFRALKGARKPLSAYDILNARGVRARGLSAPVTIYRALEKLVADGLVHRIETLNAFVVCDRAPHGELAAFMICSHCKRACEMVAEECWQLLSDRALESGFSVEDVKIEISGCCNECRAI